MFKVGDRVREKGGTQEMVIVFADYSAAPEDGPGCQILECAWEYGPELYDGTRCRETKFFRAERLKHIKPEKRKIIQVATGQFENDAHILYALCDDGTLWWLHSDDCEWNEERKIPQPEEKFNEHI